MRVSGFSTSKRARTGDDAGFSVIEMLLVFAIVGIAMLPLAGIQFGSREAVREANRHSEAVIMAQAALEEMRAAGFNNSQPDTVQNGVFTVASSAEQFVDPATGLPSNFVEELMVTVLWRDGADPRSLTLSTLQARR